MKVNLNVPFVDIHGKPITEMSEKEERPVIMAEYVAAKLYSAQPASDSPMDEKTMLLNADLSRRIMASPESVSLSASEIAHIEKSMSRFLVSGAYGQLYRVLERDNK